MQPIPDYAMSVAEQLRSMTEAGTLKADKAQMAVAGHLDRILQDLKQRKPAAKKSALGWMFAQKRKPLQAVRGLYVHGSVGRGKTMLMDLFFKMAPVEKKRRAHFHEFMADVHARIHAHRIRLKNGETRQADPVPPVAAALREEAELLCFDEFTVTDIADAMILARLFTELFARGCTLVATSNVEPDNLYRDGLNRGLFLPFIEMLKRHVEVTTLDSPTDYRLEKLESLPVYVAPLDAEADRLMNLAWQRVTEGRPEIYTEIEMKGRVVPVPRAVGRSARFTFAELCENPLGASDYLEIARRFDVVFIDHIPYLGPAKRNETKRFIILVDALYDSSVQVFVSAAAMPETLLTEKKGTEGFEFDRTVSRLFEMRSADYLALHHANRAEL
ncbi:MULTISPECIES: cell division protein ZapE [Alphaproteobacteria]|uniref:Cell division protein ZapE n=2 Tax=Alphaproteobacteria TaxID=28211 RepID=A0A512HJY7_9HYPH|nr:MULTISPECIES: cell division protein ZapE [Alphaproteobacteria]GEO85741.1 cell division protein ZapE [Ciceribacter naphthalenivorans]GLR21899.1 cell division protein ZapE [Ciceribacter naphthalenivorans]GLT04755.1 cell division protein ZapE [Sphingomonas psychrolutea]